MHQRQGGHEEEVKGKEKNPSQGKDWSTCLEKAISFPFTSLE